MLSDRTIRTVKATAPILRERGLDIAADVRDPLPQRGDQEPLQPVPSRRGGDAAEALAGAVHACAQNIDRLDALGPAIERIARSTWPSTFCPSTIPTWARRFSAPSRDVLGQAATEEVMEEAWTEPCTRFLADVLIERERQLYGRARTTPGGWTGWQEFVVDRAVPESDVIKSFHLRPTDDAPIMPFKPGQYLTLQLDTDVRGTIGHATTASRARPRLRYRISVKREAPPSGRPTRRRASVRATSHARVDRGTTLRATPARGRLLPSRLDRPAARPLQRRRGPHADGQHARGDGRPRHRAPGLVRARGPQRAPSRDEGARARDRPPRAIPATSARSWLRVPRGRRRGGRRLRHLPGGSPWTGSSARCPCPRPASTSAVPRASCDCSTSACAPSTCPTRGSTSRFFGPAQDLLYA